MHDDLCSCKIKTINTRGTTAVTAPADRLRLLYTKSAPAEREQVDVNELIREMLVLLGDEANRNAISLRSALAAELP